MQWLDKRKSKILFCGKTCLCFSFTWNKSIQNHSFLNHLPSLTLSLSSAVKLSFKAFPAARSASNDLKFLVSTAYNAFKPHFYSAFSSASVQLGNRASNWFAKHAGVFFFCFSFLHCYFL